MNELKIFENEEFGSIREMNIDGEPWFVGKDVARVLGYTNPRKAVRDHVDEDDKRGEQIVTPYGKQDTVVINESGLYSLIMSSKMPNAKKFKRWVTGEVLPSIRKNGGYGDVKAIVSECVKEVMAQIMPVIEDRKDRISVNIQQRAFLPIRGGYSRFKVYSLPDDILAEVIRRRVKERATYDELEYFVKSAGADISGMSIGRFMKSISLLEYEDGTIEILTKNNEVLRIGEDGKIKRVLC